MKPSDPAETTLNSTFSPGQIVCEEVFKEMEPLTEYVGCVNY